MQIALLLAVVTTVTISENAPHQPVASAPLRLVLALAAMGIVVGVAAAASFTAAAKLQTASKARTKPLQWFERCQRLHAVLWLAATAGILYLLDWPQLVRYNWNLDHVVLLRDVLVMLPVWLPWILSWAAFYEVERALQQTLGQDAMNDVPAGGRVRFVWQQTRHWLALVLLPILVLLAAEQCITLVYPTWLIDGNRWWFLLLVLGGVLFFFPLLLSRLWDTAPLPNNGLAERLQDVSRELGVGCRGFRIWHTDFRVLNAAVAGFIPLLRYVFFTDALLKHLDDRAVEAVLVHEFGHIRRRHLPLRIALLSLPAWTLLWIQLLTPHVATSIQSIQSGPLNDLPQTAWLVPASMLLPFLVTAYAVVALGWYSRLLEFDADLCIVDAGRTPAFVDALHTLSKLSNENPRHKTWLHPSVHERVRRLLLAELKPNYALQFRRRVNRLNMAIVGAWVCIPGLVAIAARAMTV